MSVIIFNAANCLCLGWRCVRSLYTTTAPSSSRLSHQRVDRFMRNTSRYETHLINETKGIICPFVYIFFNAKIEIPTVTCWMFFWNDTSFFLLWGGELWLSRPECWESSRLHALCGDAAPWGVAEHHHPIFSRLLLANQVTRRPWRIPPRSTTHRGHRQLICDTYKFIKMSRTLH